MDSEDPPTYEEALAMPHAAHMTEQPEPEDVEASDDETDSPLLMASAATNSNEEEASIQTCTDDTSEDSNEDDVLDEREKLALEKMKQRVKGFKRRYSVSEEGAEELEMMDVGGDSEEDDDAETAFNGTDGISHGPEEGNGVSVHEIEIDTPRMDEPDFDPDADSHMSEMGGASDHVSRDEDEYSCEMFPVLDPIISYIMKRLNRASKTKKIIIAIGVFVFLGLILFVSLFPASFIYVNYYEMGFSRNKVTGALDYSEVYQTGCYLLAPQDEIVTFKATAHTLPLRLAVMNSGGMSIGLQVTLQYFIRPDELRLLYKKYMFDYSGVIESVAESTIKNTAVDFTLDEYRLNRTFVEAKILQRLKLALSGDCCPSCCPSCASSGTKCNSCKTVNCSQGYHVDIRHFQLGKITIPKTVMNQYMKQVILKIETEKEQYIQDVALAHANTRYGMSLERNAAKEIRKAAEADSHVILMRSKSEGEKNVEISYQKSLQKLFNHLNITDEDERISFMYLKALKDVSHNLYAFNYGDEKNTVISP